MFPLTMSASTTYDRGVIITASPGAGKVHWCDFYQLSLYRACLNMHITSPLRDIPKKFYFHGHFCAGDSIVISIVADNDAAAVCRAVPIEHRSCVSPASPGRAHVFAGLGSKRVDFTITGVFYPSHSAQLYLLILLIARFLVSLLESVRK